MAFKYKYGKHVRANFTGHEELGHVVEPAHDVQGASGPEQKYGVADLVDGSVHKMAYTQLDAGEKVPGGYFTDAA